MSSKGLMRLIDASIIALLCAPFLGALMGGAVDGSLFDSYKNQFIILQIIVMAIYNLPLLGIAFLAKYSFTVFELHEDAFGVASSAVIVIIVTLISIVGMSVWGLGLMS